MNPLVKRIFRQWSSRKYNLASYIKIEEGQVFFNLDEQALQKIHQAKIRDFPLYVPCSLRLRLLRDTLLKREVRTLNRTSVRVKTIWPPILRRSEGYRQREIKDFSLSRTQVNRRKTEIYLQLGLTFYTCYSDEQKNQIEKKKLFRSVISPDGDILHQISSSSLQHPDFPEISAAHHWLTAQLLNHLYANFNWIPRLIGLVTLVISIHKVMVSPSRCNMAIVICIISLMGLWVWRRPSIIRWTLNRILSYWLWCMNREEKKKHGILENPVKPKPQ